MNTYVPSITASSRVLLTVNKFADKRCRENHTTFWVQQIYLQANRVIYETIRKNYGIARHVTDYNITRRMRFICWIPKATNTHTEYLIPVAC